jgi:hypothetical protein
LREEAARGERVKEKEGAFKFQQIRRRGLFGQKSGKSNSSFRFVNNFPIPHISCHFSFATPLLASSFDTPPPQHQVASHTHIYPAVMSQEFTYSDVSEHNTKKVSRKQPQQKEHRPHCTQKEET